MISINVLYIDPHLHINFSLIFCLFSNRTFIASIPLLYVKNKKTNYLNSKKEKLINKLFVYDFIWYPLIDSNSMRLDFFSLVLLSTEQLSSSLCLKLRRSHSKSRFFFSKPSHNREEKSYFKPVG